MAYLRPNLRIGVDRLFSSFRSSSWAMVGVATCATLGTGLIQWSGALQLLELALLDQAFRLRQEPLRSSPVVIVTIDETDLQKWGYPLSDEKLATVLTRIQAQQPRVVGLDLYRDLIVPPGKLDLEAAFKASPTIIGIRRVAGDRQLAQVPPPSILNDRGNIAASDVILDSDGKLRRALISLKDRSQKTYYTLGTRLALTYLEQENIVPEPLSETQVKLGKTSFEALPETIGGYVRVDSGGYQILSNFNTLKNRPIQISITALLNNDIPAALFQHKIVIVGTTASSLGDRFYLPYSDSAQTSWAGVEVHADLAIQLVQNAEGERSVLQGLGWEWGLLWMSAWAVAGTCLGWWSRRRWGLVGVSCGGVVLVGIGYGAFLLGWWLPIVSPGLALIGASVLGRGSRLWDTLQKSYAQLECYSRTLEAKVQQRTLELHEKNQVLEFSFEQAQSANRAKSAFLTHMNHEFRTPLTIILGNSELLRYSSTIRQSGYLDSIDRSVSHLLDLINDVLDLSQLEANKMDYQPGSVIVLDLITALTQLFRSQAEVKRIEFRLVMADDLPQVVETDERKLRQILINLLGNAIKFTSVGQVVLTVDTRGDTLRFQVQDSGVGIAADECDRIFTPFYQSHAQIQSPTQAQVGSGLGLAISQQFAQILGGTLTVKSKVDLGSTFEMSLPIRMNATELALETKQKIEMKKRMAIGGGSDEHSHLVTGTRLVTEPVATNSVQSVQSVQISELRQIDQLRSLPLSWREHFFQSAVRLSGDRVQVLLAELPPECADVRRQLQWLLETFQFDEIQRLLSLSLEEESAG